MAITAIETFIVAIGSYSNLGNDGKIWKTTQRNIKLNKCGKFSTVQTGRRRGGEEQRDEHVQVFVLKIGSIRVTSIIRLDSMLDSTCCRWSFRFFCVLMLLWRFSLSFLLVFCLHPIRSSSSLKVFSFAGFAGTAFPLYDFGSFNGIFENWKTS